MLYRVTGFVCEHVSVMFLSRLGCQDTFALVGVCCTTVSGGECQVVSSFFWDTASLNQMYIAIHCDLLVSC